MATLIVFPFETIMVKILKRSFKYLQRITQSHFNNIPQEKRVFTRLVGTRVVNCDNDPRFFVNRYY